MINQQPANHKPPSVLFLIFMAFLFLAFAIGMVFLAFTVFYPLFLHATSYSYNIIQGDQNFHQGRYEQAISNYSQALTLKPGSAYAYTFRGSAYAKLKNYSNAKRDLEMAISLDPSAGIAYNNLCWYGSLLGDPAKVLSVCEKAVSLEPNNPHCRDSRALARALTGDYKGAILDFQFFVSQAGTDPSIKPADVSIRTQWISSLKKGINPFDPAELQKLLGNNGLKPDAPQRDVWNSNKLSYAVLPRRHQDTEIFSLFSLRCSASPWPKKPRLA